MVSRSFHLNRKNTLQVYILSVQMLQVVLVMDPTLNKLYQEFESAVKALTGRTQAKFFLELFLFLF